MSATKTPPRELLPHWLVMKDFDEELLKKVTEFRMHLTEDDTIPPKYKELMMVAMCCVIRFTGGIKAHTKYAIEMGATPKELFATAAQSMLIGGVPAYREGIMAIKEAL
jgi:alkylhydroperoxidase/carboxymuconolactone decarboxylase family protein YurZ